MLEVAPWPSCPAALLSLCNRKSGWNQLPPRPPQAPATYVHLAVSMLHMCHLCVAIGCPPCKLTTVTAAVSHVTRIHPCQVIPSAGDEGQLQDWQKVRIPIQALPERVRKVALDVDKSGLQWWAWRVSVCLSSEF